MTPAPLLYSYRRCPYAMRARMALLHARVAFDTFEISLRDKPKQMLALSPKGTVPVLRLPDGQVLEQSLDIMRWAFVETGDTEGWWARAQNPVNLELLAVCDGAFKHHLDRYKYPERFDGVDSRAHHREQAVEVLLKPLDAQLQRTGQLGGPAPCAADIAIFPFVRQFAAVEPGWFEGLPLLALKRWLDEWLKHLHFVSTMAKLPNRKMDHHP
ncbi:glutathione S-transferase domain-containing protein [Hydrogenophaga taeniospiralis CCUG 15921]|uniref:Glutathione S-transferase domain-containing protein n=1 Tax=Hydrogenophaga taeniospiralis CCUG 15921 TaxID=1281780 RepID=A0A9X4NRU8_9BURK|nr:glutathione S-transferase [Hydrogenophaga taeniospiralis]MDG5976062.1 glutathione S-transferase domain-containing protein [Hydrogenophaga taeniospiralis CCUG 15921]